MKSGMDAFRAAKLAIPLGPDLTRAQAEAIVAQGKEATIFALLQLAKMLAERERPTGPAPSTPSGMIPPYQKPTANEGKPRGAKKKPGARPGHLGARRPKPARIDRYETHTLEICPDCGSPVRECRVRRRKRYIEDIPADLKVEVTEHTIPAYWCGRCSKAVEPKVPDALPRFSLGHRAVVLSAWLHYGLGNTLSQIRAVFNHHLQLQVTTGGLIGMWGRVQEVLFPWYEQIQREALDSAVLHGDETSWRVRGKTWWLWCFANSDLTYYMIHRGRGERALREFFIEEFAGTLVSDFWGSYNKIVAAARQKCLVHLLRDLKHVEKYKNPGPHWPAFAKKLRRLIGDTLRLKAQKETLPDDVFATKRERFPTRLEELITATWEDRQARRLIKRLKRHRHELFTCLEHADVPSDNNLAERAIRPAVIIRKNSYCNRSERGADIQAVLMSVYRTLTQRGHSFLETITEALRTYVTTGQLPPLPAQRPGFG
jgi:transposase